MPASRVPRCAPALQLGTYQQQGDNGLDVHELLKPLVTRQLVEKLCLAAPRTEEVASVAADVVEANGEKRKMRVLAAEDNKTNQLVFRKMVKALDIDLKFAGNGREAVELYQSFEPDLVFMDISMPEMDGKEATRAIRTLEAESGKHVPVLALTAHAMGGQGRDHVCWHGPVFDKTVAQSGDIRRHWRVSAKGCAACPGG